MKSKKKQSKKKQLTPAEKTIKSVENILPLIAMAAVVTSVADLYGLKFKVSKWRRLKRKLKSIRHWLGRRFSNIGCWLVECEH